MRKNIALFVLSCFVLGLAYGNRVEHEANRKLHLEAYRLQVVISGMLYDYAKMVTVKDEVIQFCTENLRPVVDCKAPGIACAEIGNKNAVSEPDIICEGPWDKQVCIEQGLGLKFNRWSDDTRR